MWSVSYAITNSFDNVSTATVLLKIVQNPVPVVDNAGRIDHYVTADEGEYLVTLSHQATWLVMRIQGLSA